MEPTHRAFWRDLKPLYIRYLVSARRADHTKQLRIRHFDRFLMAIAGQAGNVDLASIKPAALTNYLGAHPEWAPNTLAGQRASLAGAFRWAHDLGYIPTNPAAHLPNVRVPSGKPKPASDAAVEQALASEPRTALMAEIAAKAGLRCMEVAKLHRDDVQTQIVETEEGPEERHSLRITGKGGKTRIVPIAAELANRLLEHTGWIFPGRIDGHVSAAYVSKLVSRVLPPGVTCHKLRHRFATRAYKGSGHNLRAVQELLGHSSVATTQVYTGLDNDELWQAALSAA